MLAFSRHTFVRPTFSMDQSAWVAAHVKAFAFFGGVVRQAVPDNLKTGVIKPDIHDPRIDRADGELGVHCRVLIDPPNNQKLAGCRYTAG